MARKKPEEEQDNPERWMVSYADFITLLFAFFVVMYAISSVNEYKYRDLAESVSSAFGVRTPRSFTINENPPESIVPAIMKKKQEQRKERNQGEIKKEKEKMTQIGQDLMKVLSPLINKGQVSVIQTPRGVNVEINASVLFDLADATLSSQSRDVLVAVAKVLKDEPTDIHVEGFTDSLPINSARYPSNWELSSARASSVVRLFAEQGLDEDRLVVIGRGANFPIDDNETAEGRARNRRVSLMVLSMMPEEVVEIPMHSSGQEAKPAPAGPAASTTPATPAAAPAQR